tara:strand:- start:154 stop:453 length:300 start_codon:yes stop_codon:yes gene_type:complete
MFASFPSGQISEKGKVKLIISDWSEVLKLISLKVGYVYPESLIDLEVIPDLLDKLKRQSPIMVAALIELFPEINPNNIILTIAWLVKLGICRYYPDNLN